MHQMRDDEAQGIHRIDALEISRFLHLEPQVGGDEIGKASGFVHTSENAHDVPGGDAAQGQDTLALFARQRMRFLFDRERRLPVRISSTLADKGRSRSSRRVGARYLQQRLDAPVGHLEQTQMSATETDRAEINRFGIVHLPASLGRRGNMASVRRGGFHGLHGLFSPHEQGHDHIVEDHHVPSEARAWWDGISCTPARTSSDEASICSSC